MKLTARKCHQVPGPPPGKRAIRYSDDQAPGLLLIVGAGGGRSWVQRIMVRGRRHDIGLGALVEVPIAAAREHAVRNQLRVRRGKAPLSRRAELRAEGAEDAAEMGAALASEAPALRELAQAYADDQIAGGRWHAKYAEKWLSMLGTHAGARLLALPADDASLTAGRVYDVCMRLIRADRHRTAEDLRRGLVWIFALAQTRGIRDTNPARDARLPLDSRGGKVARSKQVPAVLWADAPPVIARIGAEAMAERGNVALCLLALIATGARTAEVRGMRWEEVDLDRGIWTVPGDRMKSGEPHRKPVSTALRRILDIARARNPGAEHVFPSRHRDAPFAEAMMSQLSTRMEIGCSPHRWRRTMRSWCGAQDYPREVAEMQLDHAIGSAVEQSYSQDDLLARRRPMMEAWGGYAFSAVESGALKEA